MSATPEGVMPWELVWACEVRHEQLDFSVYVGPDVTIRQEANSGGFSFLILHSLPLLTITPSPSELSFHYYYVVSSSSEGRNIYWLNS
eukprot:scaffold3999_cov138-Skeletonema_dohrnii-CCMP3373.AAC.28